MAKPVALTLRQFARVAAAILGGFLIAPDASADANSARAALVANLERHHYDPAPEAAARIDDQTLVDGLYRLEDPATGQLVAMFTESGDVIGDGRSWRWIEEADLRPFTAGEIAHLRTEVMASIAWNRLVPVRYGDGGDRRILLISAVNCPICARMEAFLAAHANGLKTTFYLLPISLSPAADDDYGRRTWAQAAAIRCAADPAAAWRQYWVDRTVPPVRSGSTSCVADPVATFKMARSLATALGSVGVTVPGTPAMVREDGTALGFPAAPDEGFIRDQLGPGGRPQIGRAEEATPRRWLAARR